MAERGVIFKDSVDYERGQVVAFISFISNATFEGYDLFSLESKQKIHKKPSVLYASSSSMHICMDTANTQALT